MKKKSKEEPDKPLAFGMTQESLLKELEEALAKDEAEESGEKKFEENEGVLWPVDE